MRRTGASGKGSTQLRVAAAVWLTAALLSGCGPRPQSRRADAPLVAVSIFPLYDLVRRIAEPELEVTLLLEGGDVHAWDPSPRAVARLQGVRLSIGAAVELDGWSAEAARRAGASPRLLWLAGPEPVTDAHVWLDPVRTREALPALTEALAALDPARAPAQRERAAELAARLQALDREIRARTRGWRRRRVVTAHGFLGAYAARYGLDVALVLEPRHERELTPRRLSRILDTIRDTPELAAILVPAGEPLAAARVAAEESGLPLVRLDLLGGGAGADSYEAVLRGVTDAMEPWLR